jgi:DMSO/TMAO reductase YedYZ molybdopterin-dependent catalytic subunit
MNGEPLPLVHGGPVRLVVPGWGGNHWIKWVRGIVLSPEESPSFYQRAAYKLPRTPVPPGTEAKPEDLVPVTTLNVKSLISWPPEGSMLPPGRHEIRGVAWTGGEAVVERVEVVAGTDPNAWQPATLEGDPAPYSWRLWKYSWDAKTPGRVGIRARAYDSTGAVQPEITPWNKSGYLWNGIDRVSCEVR